MLLDVQAHPNTESQGRNCFCELAQLRNDEQRKCQSEAEPDVDGWCYVDATTTPPVGSPDLIAPSCPPSDRRMIRFVGDGRPLKGASAFIACAAEK